MQHPKRGRNSDDIHSGRQLHPRSKLLNVLLTSAPLRSSWEIQTKAVLKSIAEMFPLCLNNRDLRALRGRHLPCSSLSPAQCSRNNRDKLQVGTFSRMKTISESTQSSSINFPLEQVQKSFISNKCPNLELSKTTRLQIWIVCFNNSMTKSI